MMKEELLQWAADSAPKYPALRELREETADTVKFLFLPGERGVYRGLYLCEYENSVVEKLRRAGYAVGVFDKYETAKKILLECARFSKKMSKKHRKSGGKTNGKQKTGE
jgi:transposase-like protein